MKSLNEDELIDRFMDINHECFKDKLPLVKIEVVTVWKNRDKDVPVNSLGWFEWGYNKVMQCPYVRIYVKRGKAGDMTLTLLHEMMHYRQYLNKKKMNHDKKFRKRERSFAKSLREVYPEIIGCYL